MREARTSNKVCPREFFNVSENVSHLEPHQMEDFEEAFEKWKDSAKRADSVLGRARMWLIFKLLRHTGARLGEILALDDTTCFDRTDLLVRLGGEDRERTVPLPEEIFSLIMNTLDGPLGAGLRGTFFQVDPGYFRRICYARGKECGLSKDQVCPKAIRNTRAVEMLRNGVPITVVRDVLGQSSLDLTANFQQFSQDDMRSIVRTAHQSIRKRTSARNSFVGHVTEVLADGVMAEVMLKTRSGIRLSSVITASSLHKLRIKEGSPVIATVKAPLVNVLLPGEDLAGSVRNRLKASILRVNESQVISEVLGRLPDGSEVCALISRQSAEELSLNSGDEVEFWFKAMSVVLNTIQL